MEQEVQMEREELILAKKKLYARAAEWNERAKHKNVLLDLESVEKIFGCFEKWFEESWTSRFWNVDKNLDDKKYLQEKTLWQKLCGGCNASEIRNVLQQLKAAREKNKYIRAPSALKFMLYCKGYEEVWDKPEMKDRQVEQSLGVWDKDVKTVQQARKFRDIQSHRNYPAKSSRHPDEY